MRGGPMRVAPGERPLRIAEPERDRRGRCRPGVAMRCCAMSQATLTMCARTRCATKPGLSRITSTGTPSAANSACAASRTARRGDRRGHQRALAAEVEQRVERDGARGIETLVERCGGRIAAERQRPGTAHRRPARAPRSMRAPSVASKFGDCGARRGSPRPTQTAGRARVRRRRSALRRSACRRR